MPMAITFTGSDIQYTIELHYWGLFCYMEVVSGDDIGAGGCTSGDITDNNLVFPALTKEANAIINRNVKYVYGLGLAKAN